MSEVGRGYYISTTTMQTYEYMYHYDGIFMVWCAGYLDEKELITFLKKAKSRLVSDGTKVTRKNPPKSFIFLLDNIRSEEYTDFEWKG